MCYNLTIINNTGTMFTKKQAPAVFYTDDQTIDPWTFEFRFKQKFGQECILVIVTPGHQLIKVNK